MDLLICLLIIAAIFALVFRLKYAANGQRMKDLTAVVAPLGFEVRRNLDRESATHFHMHRWSKGLWYRIGTVCVAETDSMRIVVIEHYVCKGVHVQYYLGIHSANSAPEMLIKRRTASTKSIWTADWGDVIHQVRFEDDPEFDGKFIVRGDPDKVRAFLSPGRRKALCEATDLPDSISICDHSVFLVHPGRIQAGAFEQHVSQCFAVTKLILGGKGKSRKP
jgi:hypothetical protein